MDSGNQKEEEEEEEEDDKEETYEVREKSSCIISSGTQPNQVAQPLLFKG